MNRIVDLDKLERDLGEIEELPGSRPEHFAPPEKRKLPLPSYVAHEDGVSQLGVISAEAVVHQWELAAKAIEAMGAELRTVVERCEALIKETSTAIAYMEETAGYYRKQGAKAFAEVEKHALLVEEVRRTCEGIQQKIADGAGSA